MRGRPAILVLEPCQRARSALCGVLEDLEAASPLHVTSTRDAAEIVSSVSLDLALIDFDPDRDRAINFVRGIRLGLYSENRRLPVIAVTAAPHASVIALARDAGVHGLIARPFSTAAVALQLLRVRNDTRTFMECRSYIGPNRRRWNDPAYAGPERRGGAAQEDALYVALT